MTEYIEREKAIKALINDAPEMDSYCREDAVDCIRHMEPADVECCGRLRGVTYEDGKVTAVHIRDTDDVVKVFVPVRHGRWIMGTGENGLQTGHRMCSRCGEIVKYEYSLYGAHNFCNYCGAKMDGGDD